MNGAQHPTEPDAAQAGTDASLTNRRDWKFHAERINAAWGKQVDSIVETAKYLIEAHDEMDRRSFEAMVQQKLIVSASTARKLIVIGRNLILTNCAHWHKLPPSWGTLYELTKLRIEDLRAKLADGSISPKLERKEVADWRKPEHGKTEVDGKPIERERRPSLAEQLKTAEAKLARKDDGSLFDLKNDSVKAIAEAIVANISEGKAESLAKAIHEAIKELRRKRQKPAGENRSQRCSQPVKRRARRARQANDQR